MLETVVKGNKKYWIWVLALSGIAFIGFLFYMWQFRVGLGITGLSRDVSWGLYIAQLTFLVGVAAGGVMLVLPYYLHNYKVFGKITILGEFLAIAAIAMCGLFVLVDLGQPSRMLNILLHPSPRSILFWDMTVLNAYLILNLIIGWNILEADRNGVAPPKWIKGLIYISIPCAVGIHTVTAFLYCGLPGRHFWLTAIMAPRFLASAFAAGPSFIILLCLIIRNNTKFDPGSQAIRAVARIVTYALIINIFFFLCEIFVAAYSNIPGHKDHLQYLFFGLHGHGPLVVPMWIAWIMCIVAAIMLLSPSVRQNDRLLTIACILTIAGIWIDKGLGLISGGFIPNPLHQITDYLPTFPEVMITVGVYAIGFLLLTFLYKIAVSVREEEGA
jgi:molybdopterin-containing oxidoreductase family membrane subunit